MEHALVPVVGVRELLLECPLKCIAICWWDAEDDLSNARILELLCTEVTCLGTETLRASAHDDQRNCSDCGEPGTKMSDLQSKGAHAPE